jgi:uncharacterized protein HemX
MKKITSAVLGLSLALATGGMTFAQAPASSGNQADSQSQTTTTTKKTTKTKKSKKAKGESGTAAGSTDANK